MKRLIFENYIIEIKVLLVYQVSFSKIAIDSKIVMNNIIKDREVDLLLQPANIKGQIV